MRREIIRLSDWAIELSLYFLIFCLPFTKAGMQFFCWLIIFSWIIKKTTIYPGLFLTRIKANKSRNSSLFEFNQYFLIFIFACIISLVMSTNFILSLKGFSTKIIKNLLLYLIIIESICNKVRLRNFFIAIIASTSLIISDAFIQYFKGVDFLRGYSGQICNLRASFESRNGFGGWLIIMIPILIGITATKQFFNSKMIKIGLIILIGLSVVCLGMTYSRASWIGFVLSLVFMTYYFINLLNKRMKRVLIFIIIFCLIGLFIMLPQSLKIRIGSIVQIDNSSLFRINLWRESLEIIQDFPLFGIGLNAYSKVGPQYSRGEGGYYPHNSYLQMSAEIGILGFASFSYIIIKLFGWGNRVLKKVFDPVLIGLLTAMLAFLIHSFFDVSLYSLQLATLFWLILGLTICRINLLIAENKINI